MAHWKRLVLLPSLLLVCGAAMSTAHAQVSPSEAAASAPQQSAGAWREDIDTFAREMELRHKNLYHTVSREDFQRAVAGLKARVPQLQRHEIIVELMRLAAMVGDGHTNIYPWDDKKIAFRLLPVKFYVFDEGLYITSASPAHASLAGARVESFGGVAAAEAIERVSQVIGKDNESGVTSAIPVYLAIPEVLNALRLSPTKDSAVLGLSKGNRTWTVMLESIPNDVDYPGDTDIALETPAGWKTAASSQPLWLQNIRQRHRLIPLPQQSAIYAQLNEVYNTDDQSLADFGASIRKLAEQTNPKRVVLDLRHDRGGNGDLLPPFVREMIKLEDDDTQLLVIIGRATFSAAQFLLDDLDTYSTAILIGEPSGSKPNHYGDSRGIALPNSGIKAYASTLWWQKNQDFARKWTAPEVAAPLTFAAFVSARDPALEAALSYKPGPPLRDVLLEAAKTGGIGEVRRAFDAFAAETRNRYIDLELSLILSGWELFKRKQNDQAIAVLEYATKRFPNSFDAFNFLAQAAMESGQTEKARAANARALQILPKNAEALERAKKLRN